MRQVPNYLIIGSGKMATHFCHYLSLLNLPYVQWSRKSQSAQALNELVAQASHIILLISDSYIEDFSNTVDKQPYQTFVHFSGQLSLENIHSAHPLSTFSNELYEKENYLRIPFILEKDKHKTLAEILPGIPNHFYHISSDLKSYYHAMCVLSGNFTCILWQKFFHELKARFHLPENVGFAYLEQTMKNILNHPAGALTGPLARKDTKTIQANMQALENDTFLEIYQSFVNIFQ